MGKSNDKKDSDRQMCEPEYRSKHEKQCEESDKELSDRLHMDREKEERKKYDEQEKMDMETEFELKREYCSKVQDEQDKRDKEAKSKKDMEDYKAYTDKKMDESCKNMSD